MDQQGVRTDPFIRHDIRRSVATLCEELEFMLSGVIDRRLAHKSLTPFYQGCTRSKLEVIVIDNGSSEPPKREGYNEFARLARIIRLDGNPSPVHGLNVGIKEVSFDTISVMIDGAHVLSPRVVHNVSRIVNIFPRLVINAPQYTMVDVSQNISDPAHAFEREY